MLPDTGGRFPWASVNGDAALHAPQKPRETLNPDGDSHRLPSMSDHLLHSAPSKLVDCGGGDCSAPMFRTASGKSVGVRQSSIRKAASVLGGGEGTERGGGGVGASGFRTGLGKSVMVRQSSIEKAESVLAAERGEDGGGASLFQTGSGRPVFVSRSSVQKATSVLGEVASEERDCDGGGTSAFRMKPQTPVAVRWSSMQNASSFIEDGSHAESGGDVSGVSMFQTALGRSVTVNQCSIQKATCVLAEGETPERGCSAFPFDKENNGACPMFQTGSGKSFTVQPSSIRKAVSVLERDISETGLKIKHIAGDGCENSNFVFQTGSEKSVNISSASLLRAASLLGLEENCNISTSQSSEHSVDRPCTSINSKFENSRQVMWPNLHSGTNSMSSNENAASRSDHQFSITRQEDKYTLQNMSKKGPQNIMQSEVHTSPSSPPAIKFQTASGRSLSISHDALQRARNLLGESDLGILQNEANIRYSQFSFSKEETIVNDFLSTKEIFSLASSKENTDMGKHLLNGNPPSGQSSCKWKQSSSSLGDVNSEGIMLNTPEINVSIQHGICRSNNKLPCIPKSSSKNHCLSLKAGDSKVVLERRFQRRPLREISNNINANITSERHFSGDKKRLGARISISPFKRPRSSRFSSPLNTSSSNLLANGSSNQLATKEFSHNSRVSSHYPFQFKRKDLCEFFGRPPYHSFPSHSLCLYDEVKHMTADKAEKYEFSRCGSGKIGVESFQHMLLQSGASISNATKEWVTNHYKWIVWKLACLERWYPTETSGKYLTVSNVMEELKYRYDREVNYGHRSAVKKILDGDASPASVVVLCISDICSGYDAKIVKPDYTATSECTKDLNSSAGAESNFAKIELTDGWYSLNAVLDVKLSKHLLSGKLFVGQKIQIWGAGLCGWTGPVSPFEASKAVYLLIHINGTYRAHWADRLGFCKAGRPLSFNCIKGGGGPVPRTLVGVTRVYPVLYKERLRDGVSIVRSEMMENKILQLYNQRSASIAEDIMSEQKDYSVIANDNEEGAKLFKILQSAAEPDILMADMSFEQLASVSAYQAKLEAIRQSDVEEKIEKALKDAGLCSRQVTPFMKVRVIGLSRKNSSRKGQPREGLITIWNPTEKQKFDLVEGNIYSVAGLVPLTVSSDIIYLQTRGSSSIWKRIPSHETFKPFYIARRPVLLSNLHEAPLASEFDTAAVVLHVGEVYVLGLQKKQWVFVTDGSGANYESEWSYDCLLAISFCIPNTESDTSAIVNQALSGSTIGLYNLIKRPRDQSNHIWVAEATETSTYTMYHCIRGSCHLKKAADAAQKWANVSSLTIQKLKERVLCIISGCES